MLQSAFAEEFASGLGSAIGVSIAWSALMTISNCTHCVLQSAFAEEFASDLGSAIEEVVIGSGPSGELRYPSYLEANGWRFPGVSAQCKERAEQLHAMLLHSPWAAEARISLAACCWLQSLLGLRSQPLSCFQLPCSFADGLLRGL